MDLPKISLITPSYNQGRFLEATMRSVHEQNYPNLEHIVIDGGSTDDSVDVIRRYESKLAYWVSEKDKGQPDALNKGFARATGDLYGFINSDDTLAPGALMAAAQAYMQGHQWITGWVVLIEDDGEWPQVPLGRANNIDWMINNPICQQATYWSGKVHREIGGFWEHEHLVFDYEFWLRLWFVAKLKPHMLKRCMGGYRLHGASKTVSLAHAYAADFQRIREIYGKHLTPGERQAVDEHFREQELKDHRRLGWAALKQKDVPAARKHAKEAFRRNAFSVNSLRLMYCAMRGH